MGWNFKGISALLLSVYVAVLHEPDTASYVCVCVFECRAHWLGAGEVSPGRHCCTVYACKLITPLTSSIYLIPTFLVTVVFCHLPNYYSCCMHVCAKLMWLYNYTDGSTHHLLLVEVPVVGCHTAVSYTYCLVRAAQHRLSLCMKLTIRDHIFVRKILITVQVYIRRLELHICTVTPLVSRVLTHHS